MAGALGVATVAQQSLGEVTCTLGESTQQGTCFTVARACEGPAELWMKLLCGTLLQNECCMPRAAWTTLPCVWSVEGSLLMKSIVLARRQRSQQLLSSLAAFFCNEMFFGHAHRNAVLEQPIEWQELRGVQLRQLQAGAFHCCALTPRGELYTFGHRYGRDHANGNLLGCGNPDRLADPIAPPQQVVMDGLGPIAEVACSTYCTVAVTVDGRAFSWGDCDGDALGHTTTPCHSPIWLRSLRWHRVSRGGLSYTNGAVATDEGRVFVWGGNAWEGGIAGGRNISEPSEVKWSGVPSCYRCTSVALAHKHGYLIFRKLP